MKMSDTYKKDREAAEKSILRSVINPMHGSREYLKGALEYASGHFSKYDGDIDRMTIIRNEAREARDSGNAKKFEKKTGEYSRYCARIAKSLRLSYITTKIKASVKSKAKHEKAEA
jgi:hypothetical protein